MQKEHGYHPEARLQRIHVLVEETHGAYFGIARTIVNRRRPDGTGWQKRQTGNQGIKSQVFWVGKDIAATKEHAAALFAGAGIWRTRRFDETHTFLPSDESVRLLRAIYTTPTAWPAAGPEPLPSFRGELHPLLRDAGLQVGGGNQDTLEAMRAQLNRDLKAHHGEESQELLSWITYVQRSRQRSDECRCRRKSRFATPELADLAILQFAEQRGKRPVRWYKCPDSDWLHLTSQLLHRGPAQRAPVLEGRRP